MNAIIYARQSSGKDDYSESVETQIENCRRLAEKEQLNVIGCFSDLNTSGKTYPEGAEKIAENDAAFQSWFAQQTGSRKFRGGLGEVFRKLRDIDYLIVDEMTRLYRPVTRSFLESFVNQKLTENSVQILQCKGGRLDLKQFDQQLIQTLKNQIQDEAIANQKKKSKEQFRKMRDAGYQCNGAKMFGIRYLGNREIEVIPECAEVIRFIYRSIAEFRPYSAIIREVNLRYRHCFRKYCYESTLYSIARQPIYCGYQYDSQHELIRNVQIAGKEIISYELWQKVASILNSKKKEAPVRAKKHWLPMSGRLVCGCCGGKLTCQIDRGKLFYQCNKVNLTHEPGCSQSRIRFTGPDGRNGLYEITYPVLLLGLLERYRKNRAVLQGREQLEEIRKKIFQMKEKEQQLFDMFVEGIVSKDQLEDLLRKHKQKRQTLQARLQLESSIDAASLEHERLVEIPELFQRIRNRLLDNAVYEQLFRETVRRAVVHPDRVEYETVGGSLVIPRIIHKNRKYFPQWVIESGSSAPQQIFAAGTAPVRIKILTGRENAVFMNEYLIYKTI